MRVLDYILIAAVAVGVVLALRSIQRQKKHGGGCCGCSGRCDACGHPCGGDPPQPRS